MFTCMSLCVPKAFRSPWSSGTLDIGSLERELQAAVSYHVDTGNQIVSSATAVILLTSQPPIQSPARTNFREYGLF